MVDRWTLVFAATVALAGCTTERTGTDFDPVDAVCDPVCTGGTTCCEEGAGTVCVNVLGNVRHCGECGNACGLGGTCSGGMCRGGTSDDGGAPPVLNDGGSSEECFPTCSSSQRCCGGDCVNRSVERTSTTGRTDSSFTNCGGCGIACDSERASTCASPLAGGPPACLCGNFTQCPVGLQCVPSGVSFQCVDTNSDSANCGEVGNACQSGETCLAGVCRCGAGPTCGAGNSCCSGSCLSTAADPSNCGACGNVCPSNAPDCRSSVCTCGGASACAVGDGLPPPFGSLGESCCAGACVANSDASCACEVCDPSAGEICSASLDLISGMVTGDVCCSVAFGLDCGLGGGGGFPIPF